MSLLRKGYAVSTRRGFLGALFFALLALALLDQGVAIAQEVKQIKLTEKHIQGFMAAFQDMAKLYDAADPDKPDPKVEAQAEAIAKKNGFASLDEFDDVSFNISMTISGIDPQTRINLWRILEDLNRSGQTILLTTHYMEEADILCERVAIIDHGKALAVDTPAELKRRHGAETLITVTVDGNPAPLAERAERLDAVRSVERDGELVRVHAARSEGVLAQLVQEAAGLGLPVRDASSLPPSLETVFLNLTGREYRE